MPQPSDDAWSELLDALERAVADRDRMRRDGIATGAPPALPSTPGPIPAPLVPRARNVLAALGAQEAVLAADLVAVRAELTRVTRGDAAGPRSVAATHHGGFEARA